MTILVLCREEDLIGTSAGILRALRRRGIHLVFTDRRFLSNGDLRFLLERCPERPSLILHPEVGRPLLPWGLTATDIRTACFQIDIYSYTDRRIHWSMLFDFPILFHTGFERRFEEAGHFGSFTLIHAVDSYVFTNSPFQRKFQVSFVGTTVGPNYRTRREVLSRLGKEFLMNEWWRWHSYEQVAEVYQASKLVVNVARNDFPVDVSLRFAEAMAAGALFITAIPGELQALGFEENVHYVGYHDIRDIPDLVRRYLSDESARWRIADAGREKVLREHTYDARVETLLQRLGQDTGKYYAPARNWPEDRVRLAYLEYFAASHALDCAAMELRKIVPRSLRNTGRGLSLLARAYARKVHNRLVLHGTLGDQRGSIRIR